MAGSLFQADLLTYVGRVAGFVGIGGLLDRLVAAHWRDRLSRFILGGAEHPLRQFESDLIIGLLEVFCRDFPSRLSLKRIALYSAFISFVATLLSSHSEGHVALPVITILFRFTTIGIIVLPCGYLSMLISKELFFHREPASVADTVARILIDFILSLTPPFLIASLIINVWAVFSWDLDFLETGLVVSILGVVGLTLVQISCLISGLALRVVSRTMAKDGDKEELATLRKIPFTIMFSATAVIMVTGDFLKKLAGLLLLL